MNKDLIAKREEQLKAFAESDDNKVVSRLIAWGYLVWSVGKYYMDDAIEILDKYEINKGKLKTKALNLERSFDSFNETFKSFVIDDDAERRLCNDFSELHSLCDTFFLEAIDDNFVTINPRTGRIVKHRTPETVTCLIIGHGMEPEQKGGEE